MGGLLLSLTAMVGIMTAKKAFAPKFHEVKAAQKDVELAPGGSIRIRYSAEPGHFMPPGFPTRLVVYQKTESGSLVPKLRLAYRDLVEKEVIVGRLESAGAYSLEAELMFCKYPGEEHCAKALVTQSITVKQGSTVSESIIQLDPNELALIGQVIGVKAEMPKVKDFE